MNMEKTVIIVKHDGVQRGLIGEIIKRFEQRGLRLAGIKMIHADKKMAEKHYQLTEKWIVNIAANTRKSWEAKGIKVKETDNQIAEKVRKWNMDYLTEGPVVAMLWESYHAIEIGRKLVGTAEARAAPPGTIRGDFTVDSYELADKKQRPVRNLVHASGNDEEASNEIKLWFKNEEVYDWKRHDWKIIH